MHENNSIVNVVITGALIALVLVAVWGTTFAAQAITGKCVIRHGYGKVCVAVPPPHLGK